MKLFGYETEQEWDYENGFYITSHVKRISKLVAHYELYKRIVDLPGHVVECGVYKGASLIRFLTFREVLESAYSRKVIGFDAFGKFPEQQDAEDAAFVRRFEEAGGDGVSRRELVAILEHKGFGNYELVEGDVTDTVPAYLADHAETKIALLHLDVDAYQPSVVVLENLYDRVVAGGLLVLDDYGTVAGETRAIDEFFADRGEKIQKLSVSHIPAFITKGEAS